WSDRGLFLLSAAVSLAGATTLEQPREVTVGEGNAVTIQCSMKDDHMMNFIMFWYRQGPRGALEWICTGNHAYGEGFKDHFKASLEESKNIYT
ncbi:HV741 protein, partial [Donacobius atricapilla]|nr:HV741 protein [Donacobius atricapilla]